MNSLVFEDTMVRNLEYIRFYPPFGYGIHIKTRTLLGSTTKKYPYELESKLREGGL